MPILIVVAVMLVGQALESAVLSPNIIGSEVGLHPVWLIFALLTFSYLFGFLGLLVAVPVSAAIGVLVRFALKTYLASSVYKGRDSAEA
jgi:predicted PurR-regulated permease PerM